MLKANSAECRQPTPMNEQEIHRKATDLWQSSRRKALVDIYDIRDQEFKQQVINYADNKYGKGCK
jgi:hypothetical protein